MNRLTLAAKAAVIALSALMSLGGPVAALDLGVWMGGDEVQSIRTCRPGERPTSPRACRLPGQFRPAR